MNDQKAAEGVRRGVVFVTVGSIRHNASIIRAVRIGHQLVLRNIDVGLVLLDSPDNRRYLTETGYGGVPLWTKRRLTLERSIVRTINGSRYQVVHSINANLRTAILYSCGMTRKPLITDWDELLSANQNPWWRRMVYRITEYIHLRFAKIVLAASDYLRIRLSERTSKPILYLPYAAVPNVRDTPRTHREDKRHRAKILYLGSFSHLYASDVVELTSLLDIAVRRDYQLHLIGEGPMLLKFKERASSNSMEHVVFHGHAPQNTVDDLIDELGIEVCFLPLEDTDSNRFRCPNKLFHYMKTGRPIVTCLVGEPAKILGAGGYYYSYRDKESLETAIETAIHGRARYDMSKHTWAARADEYLRLLAHYCAL